MQRSSSQSKNLNPLPFNRNRQNGTDKPSSDVLTLRKNQNNSTSQFPPTSSPMFYFGFEKSPSSTDTPSEEIPYFDLGPGLATLTLRTNLNYGALSTFHPGQPQPQDENRSRSSSLSSTSSSSSEGLQFVLEP